MISAEKGGVAPVDIAYLTDRVLAAEGKPQRYGTQCVFEDGKPVAKQVEDAENLDKRRRELGLEPMDKYLQQIAEVYGVQKSPEQQK